MTITSLARILACFETACTSQIPAIAGAISRFVFCLAHSEARSLHSPKLLFSRDASHPHPAKPTVQQKQP